MPFYGDFVLEMTFSRNNINEVEVGFSCDVVKGVGLLRGTVGRTLETATTYQFEACRFYFAERLSNEIR